MMKLQVELMRIKLKGNPLSPTLEMRRQREQVVNHWFYAIDGKSSERVANVVLETINKRGNNCVKHNPVKIMTHDGFTKAGLKNFANFLGTRTLGFGKYDKLKSYLLKKPRTISKEFGLKDVRPITERLSKIGDDFKAVKVENVRNEHCYLKMVAHCSIRLSV